MSSPTSDPNTNLVWIDLEMTGLDWEIHRILEVACIITNKDLEILEEGPDLVTHQPEEQLQKIDQSVVQTFLDSGLTQASRESQVSVQAAEKQVLELVKKYCGPQKGVICGNGIYLDRAFLFHQMPTLYEYLHHRIIDVSSIKELYKRWRSQADVYKKKGSHRALTDIKESIEELKFYVSEGFLVR